MENCCFSKIKPVIYVDSDACPVKSEVSDYAERFKVKAVFVTSIKNKMNTPLPGDWVYVDWDKEAVDLYIMNHAKEDDIVITADIGLAAGLLGSRVHVLSPKGVHFTDRNIEAMLSLRHVSAKTRRQGKRTKGPKAYTHQDRECFKATLIKILSNCAGNYDSLLN